MAAYWLLPWSVRRRCRHSKTLDGIITWNPARSVFGSPGEAIAGPGSKLIRKTANEGTEHSQAHQAGERVTARNCQADGSLVDIS
jgi:hypothetical protein